MGTPINFMDSPLVIWCQTFRPDPVTYKELFDGVFLSQVMQDIDPKCSQEGINSVVEDGRDRIQNWDILMKNIKAYYKEVLQQMIVMKLPNIVTIGKEPESDAAREELTKVLLLLLGCAMQCEVKETFIENIKSLEVDVQHAIVEYIKEITDETKNVFAIEVPHGQMDDVSRSLYTHLHDLITERDGYIEEIKELNQALEELFQAQQASQQELDAQKAAGLVMSSPGPPSGSLPGASTTPEKHHLNVELAESKAKLRKVRQELEDKTEIIGELQEELDELKATSTKLRSENLELVQDARSARTYRDELDILKEKTSRVDKYEMEISRYKERLNELEFFKKRTEELRDDNQVLTEARVVLEEQLAASHKRVEAVINLEEELVKYKQQVEEMAVERDFDRQKIQEITEINARLEFEKKSSLNENFNLEDELVKARRQLNVGLSTSLSEQFTNSSNARLLRLELENQKLQQHLEEQQENTALESNTRLLELQKENLRLRKEVEGLQNSSIKEVQGMFELEQKLLSLTKERDQILDDMDTIKESSQRQIDEVERECEHLQKTNEALRQRNEKTLDLRVKDTEKENKRLHDSVKDFSSKVSKLEFENKQLIKSCQRLEENVKMSEDVKQDNMRIEYEADDLKKQVATLQLTCDKYERLEQEASDIERENEKLCKTVDNLKGTIAKLKTLEQDNINLTVETQSLRRTIETMKNSSSKLGNLEQEKHELHEEIEMLQRNLDKYKAEQSKQEQLESDLYELDTENQKLQRSLEAANRKSDTFEKKTTEMENQITKLEKALENSRLSTRKADTLEKETKELELENSNLHKEKTNIEKENRRIKQILETKEVSLDELNNKISLMERENKNLQKYVNKGNEVLERLEEVEQENVELLRQSTMDKRALSELREDCVSEKLHAQQLSNELEKVSNELKKVGLSREKLKIAVQAEDNSKYKALESLMDVTYKKSLELKEDKVNALESRLEESKSRNVQLQEELKSVKQRFEALQQRREEEILVASSTDSDHRPQQLQNPTREILELKDNIISVERKNATLEADVRNNKAMTGSLQERLRSCDEQNLRLQSQLSSLTADNSSLQTQLAKTQVDSKTLQSHNASLLSQNSALQKDFSKLESDRDRLANDYEELNTAHHEFVSDHETLERLHEQVTKEYEEMISEHGSLKSNYKALKSAYEDLVDENSNLAREKEAVSQLKQIIAEDEQSKKSDSARLSHLQMEYVKLKEENVSLQNATGKATRKYNDLLTDHKAIKQEYNNLKMKHSEVEGLYGTCKDQLSTMDVEINKLINKCQTMSHLNVKLEEDNRALMMQVQALLTQNQDLLVSSLDSKDQLAEEQKQYMEKLADLRRQKEQLEDKIMEQYKRYDPLKKKNRGFGANLMRKAKQMVSRSKSRDRSQADLSTFHDSAENSSLGSGSVGENVDGPSRSRAKGRRRPGRRANSPKLSRGLAKSTTALNALCDEKPTSGGFALRGYLCPSDTEDTLNSSIVSGAKSSENLLADTRRRSDGESLSSSSDPRNPEWSARPSRRRILLDSNSSSNLTASGGFGRNGSISSEDTGTPGGRERLQLLRTMDMPPTPTPVQKHDMAAGDDEDDDDDDDDDGLITLSEFLSEVNKSPKSRRKYIQKTILESPHNALDDAHDTTILSPDLGPRPPIIEKKEESVKLKARNWKSEINIAQLSRTPSGGSAFHTLDRRRLTEQYSMGVLSESTPVKSAADLRSPGYSTSTPVQPQRNQAHLTRAPNANQRNTSFTNQNSSERERDRSYSSERDRSLSSEPNRNRHSSASALRSIDDRQQAPVQRLYSSPGNYSGPEPSNNAPNLHNGPSNNSSFNGPPPANTDPYGYNSTSNYGGNNSTSSSSGNYGQHNGPLDNRYHNGAGSTGQNQPETNPRPNSSYREGSGLNTSHRESMGLNTSLREGHGLNTSLRDNQGLNTSQRESSGLNTSIRDNPALSSSLRDNTVRRPPPNIKSPMRPVSSLGIPFNHHSNQNMDNYGGQERERSQTPSIGQRQSSGSSIGSGNIGAYNAMTRQTSGGSLNQPPGQVQGQNPRESYPGPETRSGRNYQEPYPGQNQQDGYPAQSQRDSSNDPSRSLPRQPSGTSTTSRTSQDNSYYATNNNKYMNSDQAFIPGAGHRSLPRPPGVTDDSGSYPPPIRPINNPVDSQPPPIRPANKNQDSRGSQDQDSYNPGNVRNLVQKIQQQSPGGHEGTGSGSGPVPPPRRTRPMSAGPMSQPSAFSVHQRSITPGLDRPNGPGQYDGPRYESRPETHKPEAQRPQSAFADGGRSLPQPPVQDNRQSLGGPGPNVAGSTPTRPQSTGPGAAGKPRNPIWYEYGCV